MERNTESIRACHRGAMQMLPWALLLMTMLLSSGCDSLTDRPAGYDPIGKGGQPSASVPAGPHLFCLTNIGHTLEAFSLTEQRVLTDTARYLELDPVGPWFDTNSGNGFYISRVDGSGAGKNALIRFYPKTGVETGRLVFPANSNPNDLLLLPGNPGLGWVALKGSTFDDYATNGVALVDLAAMTVVSFHDLNALAPDSGGTLSSLLGFQWHAAGCGGAGCAYGVVNNWKYLVRQGRLLVLQPDATAGQEGRPLLLDDLPLGLNPQMPLALDAVGQAWVVNNGGYMSYCQDKTSCSGGPGNLQVLDTTTFANGMAGDETVRWLTSTGNCPGGATCVEYADFPVDPTGIYPFDGATAWLTTYPDDLVRTVTLNPGTLDMFDASLPQITGALTQTTLPAPALYATSGGYGAALLNQLDQSMGALLSTHDLLAGGGPARCTEFNVP